MRSYEHASIVQFSIFDMMKNQKFFKKRWLTIRIYQKMFKLKIIKTYIGYVFNINNTYFSIFILLYFYGIFIIPLFNFNKIFVNLVLKYTNFLSIFFNSLNYIKRIFSRKK